MAHILVVDDSQYSRALIRHALEQDGHTVVEAQDGLRALELSSAQTFDLITLDLLMPGMQGLELLGHLRRRQPQARFVVLTADIQNATRDELLAAGAHAFLQKPLQAAELRRTVTALLHDE